MLNFLSSTSTSVKQEYMVTWNDQWLTGRNNAEKASCDITSESLGYRVTDDYLVTYPHPNLAYLVCYAYYKLKVAKSTNLFCKKSSHKASLELLSETLASF